FSCLLRFSKQEAPLRTPSANECISNTIAIEIAHGNVPVTANHGWREDFIGHVGEMACAVVGERTQQLLGKSRYSHGAQQQIEVAIVVEINLTRRIGRKLIRGYALGRFIGKPRSAIVDEDTGLRVFVPLATIAGDVGKNNVRITIAID